MHDAGRGAGRVTLGRVCLQHHVDQDREVLVGSYVVRRAVRMQLRLQGQTQRSRRLWRRPHKGPRAALPSPSSPSSAPEPSVPAVCRRGGASRSSGQLCRAAGRAILSMRPRMQPCDLVQAALDHPTRIHQQHHLPRDGIASSLDPPPCVPPHVQGRTTSPTPCMRIVHAA